MDEVDSTMENNIGLKKRGVFTNNGTEVGLVGVPLCDIFNMDKLLLDGLEIKVKVDLNSDAFVLMGGAKQLQVTNHVKHSPSTYRPCSRQHEVGTFANHARSKRPRCPPSHLHFDQNPNTCKDHSSRGIKSYGDRSLLLGAKLAGFSSKLVLKATAVPTIQVIPTPEQLNAA